MLDEHGWPTQDLVGEQASSAAWLLAQHADFDVALQRRAPARVGDLRAQVGMDTLAQYYADLELLCSDEAANGLVTGG